MNDIWVYQPQADRLEQIMTKSGPDLRYGHAATVAGDYLAVYGGMNENGDVLSDLGILDITSKKWLKLKMDSTSKNKPPGLCFSAMVSVFYEGRSQNPNGNFFENYEPNQYLDPFLPKAARERAKDQEIVLEG